MASAATAAAIVKRFGRKDIGVPFPQKSDGGHAGEVVIRTVHPSAARRE